MKLRNPKNQKLYQLEFQVEDKDSIEPLLEKRRLHMSEDYICQTLSDIRWTKNRSRESKRNKTDAKTNRSKGCFTEFKGY